MHANDNSRRLRLCLERSLTTDFLTIDLPLPGNAERRLVPVGRCGGHGVVADCALAGGARPQPVARARAREGVAETAAFHVWDRWRWFWRVWG